MKGCALWLAVCVAAFAADEGTNKRSGKYTSLIELIANPERHVGTAVRTAGLLGVSESSGDDEERYRFFIYLTTEYALYDWDGIEIKAGTVGLREFLLDMNHKRVRLEGTLSESDRGEKFGVNLVFTEMDEVSDWATPSLASWRRTSEERKEGRER